MNWIDKTVALISPSAAIKRLKAREMLTEFRYEGAAATRDRALTGFTQTQNTESSANARDRIQLMSEARDLMQNFPLVKGLLIELATYAFGTVRYQARTGDTKRDEEYETAWEEWCRQCDISGRHNFQNFVRLAFLSMLRDGDCGVVQRMTAATYKLQLIEADRIGRPQEQNTGNIVNPDQYFSGIVVNPKTGEPLKYRIFRRTREGMYTDPVDVPASKFLHLFDPLRYDQYRGITALDAAIPTCRDIYDIMRYEKFAVKWSSSNTAVIEKNGGEPDEWNTRRENGQTLEEIQYGRINYVSEGEKVSPFQSQRPNASFEAFIQQLERQVCLSLQIPYGFFVNSSASGGGVTGRLESQKARRICARYQSLMTDLFLEPVKNSFLMWAMTNGVIKASPNFRIGRWQFSAWPTADIGRESAANIEEHKLGLKTAADIYAEQGKDWEEEFEQIAREQVTLDRLAKEYALPVDRLSQRNPNPPVEETANEQGATAPLKKKVAE
jgi:lambda family phage portal protein